MGQLSSALGVAPGTATTMVKTLADSGLVVYEPYSGVRLTPAGAKLAAMVLRRHRLVELFLVRVMGMSWAEVHDEAEQLEHAVSDRLIDRIDEMLGTPGGRSARRSDPGSRRRHPDAGYRLAAELSAERAAGGLARARSGQRVPALRRAEPAQTGSGDRRRIAQRRRRSRDGPRRRPRDRARHARGVEADGRTRRQRRAQARRRSPPATPISPARSSRSRHCLRATRWR